MQLIKKAKPVHITYYSCAFLELAIVLFFCYNENMKKLMEFKINYKLDNWNTTIGRSRANKYYANKHKRDEMNLIRYSLIGLPRITQYPIQMEFKWHIKTSISDLDNKSVKNILDEMQIMGILENDNIKHINKITHYAIKDNKDFVEVEVYCDII